MLSGSYILIPSGKGLVFKSQSVSVTDVSVGIVNFAASTPPTFSISGAITGGAGATVSLTGAATSITTANASGAYTFSGLLSGSYVVTPNFAGATSAP